jgi:hypothetical protein
MPVNAAQGRWGRAASIANRSCSCTLRQPGDRHEEDDDSKHVDVHRLLTPQREEGELGFDAVDVSIDNAPRAVVDDGPLPAADLDLQRGQRGFAGRVTSVQLKDVAWLAEL